MKKIIFSLSALAALLLAGSCQRENLEPAQQGGTVTYTVQVPGALATKAAGDYELIYEVYREAEVGTTADPIYEGKQTFSGNSVNLPLEFVKGQNFVVLFWAQKEGLTAYNTGNLRNVTLGTLTANQDNYEVFAGKDEVSNCESSSNGNVTLDRPIAQLNIATDAEGLKLGATNVTLISSFVTVKGLSKTYNVYNKEVSETLSDVEFSVAAVPTGIFGTTGYTYVAMNYIGFIDANGTTVNVDFTVKTSEGDIAHSVSSVPVKPNYKTNIIGNLISATDNYNVTLGAWGTPETNVQVVSVSTAQDLQEAIDNIQPGAEGNIILEGNIDLGTLAGMISTKAGENPYGLLIPAGKTVIIDLNGNTLSWTSANQNNWMIENKGTLSLIGEGNVVYNYAGVNDPAYGKGNYTISNSGNLVVDGPTVSIKVNGQANNVKYAHALYVVQNSGKLTLESGRIENYHNVAVRQWIGSETVASEVVVNGGEIYGIRAIWMQLPNSDTSKAPKGILTINGGALSAWENAPDYDSDCKLAVYSYSHGNQMKNVEINVAGGTINGDIALNGGRSGAKVDVEKVTVTGGTFNGYYGDLYSYAKDDLAAPAITIKGGQFSSLVPMAYLDSADEVLTLAKDIAAEPIKFNGNGTLDLNGKTITGNDETTGTYCLITNVGTLKIKNSGAVGTIKASATNDRGWGARSAVLSNEVGGNLTVDANVLIQHLGGTAMAYGIDNLTNGKGTAAVTVVNGATVKSTYRAIRQFLNGVEAANELYVKAGSVIESTGGNKSIWMQDPSKNPNSGKLVVEAGAYLRSDAYLDVEEGSTEWPIEVSIAASALVNGAKVVSELPEGYSIAETNGVWTVVRDFLKGDNNTYTVYTAAGLKHMNTIFADKTAGRDAVLNIENDIDFTGYYWTPVDSHADTAFEIAEINGNGHTISNLTINGQAMFTRFAGTDDVVVKDITFDNAKVESTGINVSVLTVQSYQNVLLDNVDVKNSTFKGAYKVAPLIGTVYNESPSAITATLKNCDVENCEVTCTSYDFCTTGMVAFVYEGNNDRIEFENCTVKDVKLFATPNGYSSHAAIYVNDAETDDCFNEAEGVTVTNVTFTAL